MLHTAFMFDGKRDASRLLLESGYPVTVRDPIHGSTALECAFMHGIDEQTFIMLFSYSVKLDPDFHCRKGESGRTPLHFAAANGADPAIIRRLCDYGSGKELMLADNAGRLPIHLGVMHRMHFHALRELIVSCPESIHVQDHHKRTPLQIAVASDTMPGVVFEICRLDPKALDARDSRGRSVLHLAVLANAP